MIKIRTKYRITRSQNENNSLAHAGKKGMRWDYNDGQKNGKKTAASVASTQAIENIRSKIGRGAGSVLTGVMDVIGVDERKDLIKAQTRAKIDTATSRLLNKNNTRKNQVKINMLTVKYARTPLSKLERSQTIGKKFANEILKRINIRR